MKLVIISICRIKLIRTVCISVRPGPIHRPLLGAHITLGTQAMGTPSEVYTTIPASLLPAPAMPWRESALLKCGSFFLMKSTVCFDADKQGANTTYLNHGYFYQLSIDLSATQREMGEYALMKMYGDAINLTRRSRHGTDNAVVLSIDSVSNNVINYNPCN